MEEDDPVVQEIPVFLSQALANHLYIYQYPVKPANRDWTGTKVVNALIKPKNEVVKLELGLDTYSDKYCSSKGEQIAINTDGQEHNKYVRDKEKDKSQYFKNGVMDKIVYESSKPCTDTSHYAVAILQDKELHCTPIKGIVQLRPMPSYFDKQDKRKKETDKADNSDDDDDEAEMQQITVKFKRQETEVAKKAREKSYDFISKKSSEEPWYEAIWRNDDTDHAELERMKLFSANLTAGAALSLRPRDYIRALVPAADNESPTNNIQLIDKCKEILANGKLMSFSELVECVTRCMEASEAGVAGAAGAAGSCVRGVWAARSDALYRRPSPAHGVPAAIMCAARDHVLYLLNQSPYVDRRKVAAAVRLPTEEVLEILQSVAKYNPQSGWELLVPPDPAFEAKYPEIVQRHNLYWEARQRQFNEMFTAEVPKRQRKKSQRESFSSDTIMSPKQRYNSYSEDDSDKKRKGKSTFGGKRTRHASSSSAQDT